MKTALLVSTPEDIVRAYFEAFAAHDVDGMMEYIHPAINYLRSVNGKLETVINGSDKFRRHVERNSFNIDAHLLQHTRVKSDPDMVEIKFSIVKHATEENPEQLLTGRVVFWFMDELIFQVDVQMEINEVTP